MLIGCATLLARRGNRRHLNADLKIYPGKVGPKAQKIGISNDLRQHEAEVQGPE